MKAGAIEFGYKLIFWCPVYRVHFNPYEYDYKVTLKCTADAGSFYRTVYPGKVVRGYHCPPVQQPYWNTIYLDDFPDVGINMKILYGKK